MKVPSNAYILLTIIFVMTVSVSILQDSCHVNSNKAEPLCSKLDAIFQRKNLGHPEQGGNKGNKNNLRAVYLIGCKNKGNALCPQQLEKRNSGGALLDLLDYVIKPKQTKPIYAPSVLLLKKPKKASAFWIWDKLPVGKK